MLTTEGPLYPAVPTAVERRLLRAPPPRAVDVSACRVLACSPCPQAELQVVH